MSSAEHTSPPKLPETAIWQQVEFGSYEADLPIWADLADAAGGPVLELGAGAGRVAIHLADKGHDVIALERDPLLLDELRQEAGERRLAVQAIEGDLAAPTELRLPSRPAVAIGPLHVLQVVDGSGRPALLTALRELLAPGATLALTIVDESTLLSAGTAATQILPDMRELDGWVYSSEPLWVQVSDDILTVRRLRERVSPGGEMKRAIHDEVLNRVSAERLELESREAGFEPSGRHQISSGPNEADSILVLLKVSR
jgi:SAM-dependent methyltransferase